MKEIKGTLFKRATVNGKTSQLKPDSDQEGNFYVAYVVHGKRTVKNLKTTDYLIAKSRWAEEKVNLLPRNDTKESEEEWLRKQAEIGDRAKALLHHTAQSASDIPLAEAFERYLANHSRPSGTKEVTLADYRGYFNRFLKWAPQSLKYTRDLTREICDQYVSDLEKGDIRYGKLRPKDASTVNKHLVVLRIIWHTLHPDSISPWAGKHSLKKPKGGRYRALSCKECKAIHKILPGEHRTLFMLAYSTGQRVSDLAPLSWDEIDMKKRIIHVIPKKTDARNQPEVDMPMTDQVYAELLKIGPQKTGWVLQGIGAQWQYNPPNISQVITRYIKKAKIPDTNKGHPSLHSCRKTFASMLTEAGAPQQVISYLTSHTLGGVNDDYNEPFMKTLRRWVTTAILPL
ncbi:MAG: tyrosine-type recombinase/integrase [bacterium]